MFVESVLPLNGPFIAFVIIGALLCGGIGALVMYTRLQPRYRQQRETDLQQIAQLRENNIALQSAGQALEQERDSLRELVEKKEHTLESLREKGSNQQAELASLNMALKKQQQGAEEKLALLSDAKTQLTAEFELLANRIFEEKNDRFNQSNRLALDSTLAPLKQQLSDFKQKVEDVYDKDSKERISLSAQLSQLKELNQQMSADAIRLTNALKGDNKTQGNWGEVILERVLEDSGLRKGYEYNTQVSLKAIDGRQRKPDVIVHLPENRDIIIDAKVSLRHFERFCSSDDDETRQQALSAHIASVRSHIRALSIKDYEKLEGVRTLDFVFIFIPVEPAFMAAFEHEPAMFREAYDKNIIVVGPTTLLATLRTVQSIWRYERQNKNAEEIAHQAGTMHDKFVRFVDDLDKIAVYIERAADAQRNALNKLSTGSGNLVSRTLKLEKLGAKVKRSMPSSVMPKEREGIADQSSSESGQPADHADSSKTLINDKPSLAAGFDEAGVNGECGVADDSGVNNERSEMTDDSGVNGERDEMADASGVNGERDEMVDASGVNGERDEMVDASGVNGGCDEMVDASGVNGERGEMQGNSPAGDRESSTGNQRQSTNKSTELSSAS